MPLDGELWAGRGRFAHAVSTVRSQTPGDAAWREMRFMVFDLPAAARRLHGAAGGLAQAAAASPTAPWVVPVPQQRATTHEDLQALLDKTVRMGGEGLMLHRGARSTAAERSTDLLKVKPYDDAEARVVAHVAGRGKHAGRLGALMVETPDGKRFKLGGGFTDAEREKPPRDRHLGHLPLQRHEPSGLPRFARFLRVRDDIE